MRSASDADSDLGSLPPLRQLHRRILLGWVVVAFIVLAPVVFSTAGTGGWGELVAVIAVMFFVFALLSVAGTWAALRYAVFERHRTLVAILGPPLLFGACLLLLRLSVG